MPRIFWQKFENSGQSDIQNSLQYVPIIDNLVIERLQKQLNKLCQVDLNQKGLYFKFTMKNEQTHRKFILFIAVFQVAVIAIFCVFVRYDEQLDSLFHANRTTGTTDGVMDNQYHSKYFSFHFPYS